MYEEENVVETTSKLFNTQEYNTNIVKIKVVGVGGGGGNAVNRMIEAGITSAEFVAVNTDKQALYMSDAHKKIQIGEQLTKGLGAGADPNIGAKAAEESKQALKEMLDGVDLLFITAGMGGGTGTGAAPVIASLSREMGILTVAVVTKPFPFEGAVRMNNAMQGIERLREYVDALLIIPNGKLMKVLPKGTPIVKAFKEADEILRKGIQGISDLIVTPSMINLDFADVKSIVKNAGLAHLGVGEGTGDDRAITAIQQAVQSPLLETSIVGASGVIINITGGVDMSLDEVDSASELVKSVVDPTANIIVGANVDSNLQDKIVVTLIATGFKGKDSMEDDFANNDMQNKIESMRKKVHEGSRDNESSPMQGFYGRPTPQDSQKPYNNVPSQNQYAGNDRINNGYQSSYGNNNGYQAPQKPVQPAPQNNKPSNGGFEEPSFIKKMRERRGF